MTSYGLVPLHGIASRHDLPLPFGFVVAGAAAALVISFVVLLFAWRRPHFATAGGVPVPGLQRVVDHRGVRLAAALLVLALYLWIGLATIAGQDRLTNPVFGFVFVWIWVGLVPVSLLFGQVWRATNPLRTIHTGLTRIAGIDPDEGLAALPARIGVWPAAVGLFGYAWLELVQPDRTTLSVLRIWVLAWLVIMIIGAVVFGRGWIGAADPFETYASTVAQLSPWRRVEGLDGERELRFVNPLAGVSTWQPPPGIAAVVAVLLGSTAFDSFANTTWWIVTVQDSDLDSVIWDTGGLLVLIGVVYATFCAAAAWMARHLRPDAELRATDLPRFLGGSLVPIVIGYAIAHYFTLLVVEGQRVLRGLSDPLGLGWNVFGTAEWGVSTQVFQYPTLIAVVQVLAILVGHVLGIVTAHEKAVSVLRPERALAGQWPMLVVMVGYTCAGLLLLFSP